MRKLWVRKPVRNQSGRDLLHTIPSEYCKFLWETSFGVQGAVVAPLLPPLAFCVPPRWSELALFFHHFRFGPVYAAAQKARADAPAPLEPSREVLLIPITSVAVMKPGARFDRRWRDGKLASIVKISSSHTEHAISLTRQRGVSCGFTSVPLLPYGFAEGRPTIPKDVRIPKHYVRHFGNRLRVGGSHCPLGVTAARLYFFSHFAMNAKQKDAGSKPAKANPESEAAEKRRPLHSIREGEINISVWSRQHMVRGEPRTFYSVTIERSYRDQFGQTRYTKSFDPESLGLLVAAIQRTSEYLQTLQHEEEAVPA